MRHQTRARPAASRGTPPRPGALAPPIPTRVGLCDPPDGAGRASLPLSPVGPATRQALAQVRPGARSHPARVEGGQAPPPGQPAHDGR